MSLSAGRQSNYARLWYASVLHWSRTTGHQPSGHYQSSALLSAVWSYPNPSRSCWPEALMKYSLLLPHSCNGWLKHTTVPLVPLPALTSIISASLAHTLAFQLSMQATHTAPWDACQEQFLIKLSPCQSFPRTRVLLIFLPALSSQSNNPGSRKTRANLCTIPKRKRTHLSAWKTEAICVNSRTSGKGQTDNLGG